MGRFHTSVSTLMLGIIIAACGGTPAAPAPGGDRIEASAQESSADSAKSTTIGTFAFTAMMGLDRQDHTATVLPGGKVLIAGGRGLGRGRDLKSWDAAELYDPATDSWSSTGPMAEPRALHTATLLNDSRVLVVGNKGKKTSPEVYDPAAGTWSPVGDTVESRSEHREALLHDGRVLVSGGKGVTLQHLASTELYDPATGTWSMGPDMADERANHTLTLLRDGRVLAVGSDVSLAHLASAELYDPAGDSWSSTGSMSEGRAFHTATLLGDGRVLVVGGKENTSAEVYEPSSGTWSSAANMDRARAEHTATLLTDGRVLVLGGWPQEEKQEAWAVAEVYDPATKTWSLGTEAGVGRFGFTATLLPDGRVLLVGGQGKRGAFFGDMLLLNVLDTAELYTP